VDLVPPDTRLTGHWQRSLLATADGRRDTTTRVSWLQAGRLYVDLRLPVPAPETPGVSCLRDLDRTQARALAQAEGFAGRLVADGTWARWERLVDLQPAAPSPDEGRLVDEGDRVVETGRDGSYVEHWHRVPRPAVPLAAVLLRETSSGAPAVLVRVGDDVGWARGRPHDLPPGTSLPGRVEEAATTQDAQDLLDTEVAVGRLGPRGAVLTRSNLPWRAGASLEIGPLVMCADGERLGTEDVAPDGRPVRRTWQVITREGDPADLPSSRNPLESRT
jgi:allophanate hydrolase